MIRLNIRNFDPATVAALHRGAQVRGITLAEYIRRLVALHEAVKKWDEEPRDAYSPLAATLHDLGLQSVHE